MDDSSKREVASDDGNVLQSGAGSTPGPVVTADEVDDKQVAQLHPSADDSTQGSEGDDNTSVDEPTCQRIGESDKSKVENGDVLESDAGRSPDLVDLTKTTRAVVVRMTKTASVGLIASVAVSSPNSLIRGWNRSSHSCYRLKRSTQHSRLLKVLAVLESQQVPLLLPLPTT